MQKMWTQEEIDFLKAMYSNSEVAELCKLFNRSYKSITMKAKKLGLKSSKEHKSKMIAKRNKIVGTNWTFEMLQSIAKQYKTRAIFQKENCAAYGAARRLNILDSICSHMITQSYSIPELILKYITSTLLQSDIVYNTRKIIKPYELDVYFPKLKIAFEYDGKGWHKNDIVNKTDLCYKQDILLITIKETNRKYEEDIKNQLIQYLESINLFCNKHITPQDIISLIIPNCIYNEFLDLNEIKTICDSYNNYKLFIQENYKLYQKLTKLKKLADFTLHMKRNRKIPINCKNYT